MENALNYLYGMLAMVAALFTYTAIKLGGVKKTITYFKDYHGKGILKGIVAAVIGTILLGVLITYAKDANAEWGGKTGIYLGLERTLQQSPQCEKGAVDDRLTSNLGLTQEFYRSGNVIVSGIFTHHSCALNQDSSSYNAFGLRMEWEI